MLSNDIIKRLKTIDSNYIISGSQAVMLYIGYDVRECGDLDLHLCKEIQDKDILKSLDISVDISYEPIPYQIYKGIRIIEFEKLLANKFNRLNTEFRSKDAYDLYFLLDLNYNKELLRKYLLFENINVMFDVKVEFSMFCYDIELEECIQKIRDNLKRIYT